MAGNLDKAGNFDRATGILISCASCVTDVQIKCFNAPADEPVKCACPGSSPSPPVANALLTDPLVAAPEHAGSALMVFALAALVLVGAGWAGRRARLDRRYREPPRKM